MHVTLSRTQLACLNVQYYVNAMDSLSHRGSCKHFQVNVLTHLKFSANLVATLNVKERVTFQNEGK